MSGFDAAWLALRETADARARNRALVASLATHLADRSGPLRLLDIGCGTGSTWRALSPALPDAVRWNLLDNDPLLLAEARRRIGPDNRTHFLRHDLTDLSGLPLKDVAAVTASALFDLCSQAFCRDFVDRIAEAGCGFYAALTYDGRFVWSRPHPLDEAVVADFNRHQRTDKGFGPALGPDATACLADHLERNGYRVTLAASPWRIGPDETALQAAMLDGFRDPVREMASLSDTAVDGWLAFRREAIATPGSLCEVGHTDLLAIPRR